MGIDAEIDVSQGGEVIQTLKDEIYCSICCSIFQDPLKLDCCDGHLCKICFDDVKTKFPSCPLCRAPEYTAKPSRLMVSVLSTITLCCPAEECKQKMLYSQFIKHKETCVYLNMKTCDQCQAKMEFEESKRHLNCVESLLENINKLNKENEDLKKSNEAKRKAIRALKFRNEEEKNHEAEMKKYEATKKTFAGLTVKHEKTLAENVEYRSLIKKLEKSIVKHKKIAATAKQKADEKLNQSELKSNSVVEELKAQIQLLRNRYLELVDKNRTKTESDESKFSATEAALQNKVEQLTEWLDNNDNEKSVRQAEVLKLQNQMTEMEKKVYEKDDQIDQFQTLEEKKKAEKSCVKYKKIAAQQSAAKQKADEKLKQSKLKSNSVIEALKAEIKVLRNRNVELVEENRTKTESEESKFSATEAALQNKVEQLTKWLDNNDNEKSAIHAQVLKLQNQMTEMEKKVAEKNDQIDKFRNVLSVESCSPEVIKLKNEIGRVEQSAILYFQMYKKEKKLNQEMQSRITSCFSCSSSLIFKICPK